MKEKIYYLDALRFIATIAVVLMHTSSAFYMDYTSNIPWSFKAYHYIGFFAVPVFVMISGALFLSPERDTSYPVLLRKYVRRIVLALLLFGLPMCMMESFFVHSGIFEAFYNFITGNSWTHMWYLYMLICLYLLTPLLKPLFQVASRGTIECVLIVLFVLSSVMPTLKGYGIPLKSWMIIDTPFLFYYLLGYYLARIEHIRAWRLTSAFFLILYVFSLAIRICFSLTDMSYADAFVVFGASALFLLFERLDVRWAIATQAAPYCFAVYLVHPVFINVFRKVLHINIAAYASPAISVPVAWLLILLMSFAASYLLRLIPWMRKYVL